ncbi:MAG: class I SAM-dependent methyltransferase [Proteobacteria bacterium]|nr:class I SAM-dependent methyltransferase [Pseudomonadota bacterium]
MAETSVRFDRAADYYDETRGHPPDVEARLGAFLAEAGGLDASSHVLEVGIGTGRISLPLAREVGAVFGVDLSRPMLDRLRAKPGGGAVRLAESDAARLPFRSESFDAAIGVHVFHLIAGWREALDEVARVLRPGAPLLLAGDGRRLPELWDKWLERPEAKAVKDIGVPREQIDSFLGGAGWRREGERRRLRFSRTISLGGTVEELENRIWSSTWQMDDEQLAALVDTARKLLLDQYGTLDRTLEVETEFWVETHWPSER